MMINNRFHVFCKTAEPRTILSLREPGWRARGCAWFRSLTFSLPEHGLVSLLSPRNRQRMVGGSWPRSRRRAGSGPAPSRSFRATQRLETYTSVGASASTKRLTSTTAKRLIFRSFVARSSSDAARFREPPRREVRRTPTPRTTRVNKLTRGATRHCPHAYIRTALTTMSTPNTPAAVRCPMATRAAAADPKTST